MKLIVSALASMLIAMPASARSQQITPGAVELRDASSAALENLLRCDPKRIFNRKMSERAFANIGMAKSSNGIYFPTKGKAPKLFNHDILSASIDDESDEASLNVTFSDINIASLAEQLNVKKQRVNGPSGPRTEYRRHTGKKSMISFTTRDKTVTVSCLVDLNY